MVSLDRHCHATNALERIDRHGHHGQLLQNYLVFQSYSGLNSRLFLVTMVHVSIDVIIKFGGYILEDLLLLLSFFSLVAARSITA
jgi:hypothetical protein